MWGLLQRVFMELFLKLVVIGLSAGAIYALIALGYTMVYGIIELINFAHGDIFMMGTLVTLTIMNWLGVVAENPPKVLTWDLIVKLAITAVGSFLVCAVLGVIIERIAYRPLRNAPKLAPLISAIGVSLVLQDTGKLWKGNINIPFPSLPFGSFQVGSISISSVTVFMLLIALVLMVALHLLVTRTRLGRAMRAVAQDREAAALMGVNVNRIISITFFIGAGLAGAAGFIYSLQFPNTKFSIGYDLGLVAFTCAVLGGIGNIVGAMVGGLVIGIIRSLVSAIPGTVLPHGGDAWVSAVIYGVLILILVFRPSGLLGQHTPEKV
jgi:branched-chain amino acid transport system permease protein